MRGCQVSFFLLKQRTGEVRQLACYLLHSVLLSIDGVILALPLAKVKARTTLTLGTPPIHSRLDNKLTTLLSLSLYLGL